MTLKIRQFSYDIEKHKKYLNYIMKFVVSIKNICLFIWKDNVHYTYTKFEINQYIIIMYLIYMSLTSVRKNRKEENRD